MGFAEIPTERALHICKGPNFSIEFSIPGPRGPVTAQIPLSEAARVISVLAQYVGEQSKAMNAEMAKWVGSG